MPPAPEQGGGVRIDNLPLEQLTGLKERLEGDIQRMVSSNISLQRAAGAFGGSGKAIETLQASKAGARRRRPPACPC